MKMEDSNFIRFNKNIDQIDLPLKFTFPFDYTPHPIAVLAAKQLQHYLETQKDWVHDFGIDHSESPDVMGKMFGILIVRNSNNEIGFLQAFSGIIGKKTQLPYFVPPIFDRLEPGFIYSEKEKEIVQINSDLQEIESNPTFISLSTEYKNFINEKEKEIKEQKSQLKSAKKKRQQERKQAKEILTEQEFEKLHQKHQQESRKIDFDFKKSNTSFIEEKAIWEEKLAPYQDKVIQLKSLRKQKSAEAQQLIFDQYQFKNALGQTQDIQIIFNTIQSKTPPSGAGDCAAPKLMQYAYIHNYTPIALAEFWWENHRV